MRIRAVENYNGDFTLDDTAAATLDRYLRHPEMIAEVCKQFDCEKAEYMGELFKPVPYSSGTPHGMPPEIEDKYFLKPEYGIANIPPVVMFNAKIFNPSRLCAIYRLEGLSEAAQEAMQERVQQSRNQERRKKDESERVDEWDGLGSTITEVFESKLADDDDVDLDSMVV